MPGKKKTRRKQMSFAALAAVTTLFVWTVMAKGNIGQANQDPVAAEDQVEYGVVYDCGAGKRKFKVLSCEGDEDMDRCKVQTLRDAGVALQDNWYRKTVTDAISEGCKPKTDAKKKQSTRPKAEPEPEAEPEEKPAPKPKPKPTPAPEEEPEPEAKNQETEAQPADEPPTTGPQFQLGDCVQVGNSQGIITKSDGENFYVQTGAGEKRVPLSSASKLKKATGCGG